MTLPHPAALNPAARHEWELSSLAATLGFSTTSALAAALARIDRCGYTLFALCDGSSRRVITAPHDWLKGVQQKANSSLLVHVPISDAVYSCRSRSVVGHAELHSGKSFVTAMDVADCYASTSVRHIREAFDSLGLRGAVVGALTRLATHHGFLPQGAPTSSSVLNIVFRDIDERLVELAAARHANYSRFADDIAFSSNQPLDGLHREVDFVLYCRGYTSNRGKLHIWGPRDRHIITGIDVTTTPVPTRAYYNDLSAELNSYARGDPTLTTERLEGKIAWVARFDSVTAKQYQQRLQRMNRYVRAACV